MEADTHTHQLFCGKAPWTLLPVKATGLPATPQKNMSKTTSLFLVVNNAPHSRSRLENPVAGHTADEEGRRQGSNSSIGAGLPGSSRGKGNPLTATTDSLCTSDDLQDQSRRSCPSTLTSFLIPERILSLS